jgi:hypothetical protein
VVVIGTGGFEFCDRKIDAIVTSTNGRGHSGQGRNYSGRGPEDESLTESATVGRLVPAWFGSVAEAVRVSWSPIPETLAHPVQRHPRAGKVGFRG